MVGYAKIQNTPDGLATVCNSSGGVMPGSRGDERAGPAGISTKEGGGGGAGPTHQSVPSLSQVIIGTNLRTVRAAGSSYYWCNFGNTSATARFFRFGGVGR